MKNIIFILILVLILNNFCSAQNNEFITNIDIYQLDPSLNNLSILKEKIGNSRIVLLGEPNHGTGSIFETKAKIISFLHKKMGFNYIAFESGFYDLYKAQQEINKGTNTKEALTKSIFPIWTNTEEFQPVINY